MLKKYECGQPHFIKLHNPKIPLHNSQYRQIPQPPSNLSLFPFPHPGTCFDRVLSGYRHFSSASRASIGVADRDDCAERCSQQDYCHSFSYHYFVSTAGVSDNCVLSPLSSDEWEQSHDLIADSNWDVYSKSSVATSCKGRGFDGEK